MLTPVAFSVLMLTAARSGAAPREPEVAPAPSPQSDSSPGADADNTDAENPDTEPQVDAEEPAAKHESESIPSPADLTVTAGGEELTFTEVYCKVSDGKLRHLIAKTNHRPPLLEVTPNEFAMLKMGQRGAPEKTQPRPVSTTFLKEWFLTPRR